ncbi:DUF6502 family protein [Yoonia sp. R2331]|uniref:DUF6502 family protein n=1 Tax=Yoonia sp. R2331 TaxID=3237238 RepID=UPI0034E54DEF
MNRILDALFAPIARLAVARGVMFPQAAARLKVQFLRGAEALADAPNDSRISVMTGLQRRDIARLRALPEDAPVVHHLSRLVAIWVADHPKVLDRKSFDALAASVRKDVHPRTLLEQLVDAGTVVVDADRVTRVKRSYQPAAGSVDQLDFLAANGGDFLNAGVQNVIAGAGHFERAAHFNQLSPEAVADLQALFADRQMAVLEEVAARARDLQDDSPGTHRFRAGGFFYAEESD